MSQPITRTGDFFETVYGRRSIRHYRDEAVNRTLIEQVLDAARWAPSAHNRQPWRFAVLEAAESKQRLAGAMGQRLRSDLERDGVVQELIDKDAERSYRRITSAPVVIIVCLTLRDMDTYTDSRRNHAEYLMATQSVAMATQNLLLSAHVLGLGACWMCAPLFVPDTVRETLHLDADWEPQALITLGYPAEAKTKTRALPDQHIRFLDADERG